MPLPSLDNLRSAPRLSCCRSPCTIPGPPPPETGSGITRWEQKQNPEGESSSFYLSAHSPPGIKLQRHLTCIISFIPHNNPKREILLCHVPDDKTAQPSHLLQVTELRELQDSALSTDLSGERKPDREPTGLDSSPNCAMRTWTGCLHPWASVFPSTEWKGWVR